MDEQQLIVFLLSVPYTLGAFANLAWEIRDFRAMRRDRRSPVPRYRALVMALIIAIGLGSICVGRALATFVPDADLRRSVGLLNGAVVTGALLIGIPALVYLRVFGDRDAADS